MNKEQRDKNHQFIRKLKRDLMNDIIKYTKIGLHSTGMEISESNISPEYVRRLKNEFKYLGFRVEVEKTRYTYKIQIHWEHLG